MDETTEIEQAPIEQAPAQRHVLIVEPNGLQYLAPHMWDEDPAECNAVANAFAWFHDRIGIPAIDGDGPLLPWPPPDGKGGRFWCGVSADGNFEIGGRVPA